MRIDANHKTSKILVACVVGLVVTEGCAKVSAVKPTNPTAPAISVEITPNSASLQLSGSQQFTASIQNDSQSKGVTWNLTQSGAVCSPGCGILSPAGNQALYTAPSTAPRSLSVTLAATSVVDGTKSASAQITLISSPQPSGPISVTVSPAAANIKLSQNLQFDSTVQNDIQNKGVTWALTQSGAACSPGCGTFSPAGTQAMYTAPTTTPNSPNAILTATSVADGTKSASAQITLTSSAQPSEPISVAVSPAMASIQISQSLQLDSTVQNDSQNKGVIWTLTQSGATCSPSCGSITGWTATSAVFAAPSTAPSSTVTSVTATSVADPTKNATATIYITSDSPTNTPLSNAGTAEAKDVTSLGGRATATQLRAIANCTSGSPSVTIDRDPGFINGDGVVLYGCGPATTISAPSAPTVTSGIAEGEMAPDIPLVASTGASTYRYSVFSTTVNGGLTAATPPTTIANGPSSLGMVHVQVTSGTLVGGVLTITTSSPHGMPVGTWFHYHAATGVLDGWYNAGTVTSTTVSVSNLPFQASPGPGVTLTGGTVAYSVGNQLSITNIPTGSFNEIVCGQRPGEAALHIIGAIPVGGYARGYIFTDWGPSFSLAASTFPSYITDAACTAPSSAPGYLSSTIISGAGSTSLLVANSASQTASGQTILQDSGPSLVAAGAKVYIPPNPPGTLYRINSVTTLSDLAIFQDGDLLVNEPIQAHSANWQGNVGRCAPQFSLKSTVCIFQGTAFPAMYHDYMAELSMLSLMVKSNSVGLVSNTHEGLYLDTVQFGASGLGTIALVDFGENNFGTIRDCTFNGSEDWGDASFVPMVYIDPLGNTGGYDITNPHFSGRGIFINENSDLSPGAYSAVRQVNIVDAYDQAATLPIIAVENTGHGNTGITINMVAPQIDTSPAPAISLNAVPNASIGATVQLDAPVSTGGTSQFVTGYSPVLYYPEEVYFPAGFLYPEASMGDSPNGGNLAIPRPYVYDNFNRPNSSSLGCPAGFTSGCWTVLGGQFSISGAQLVGGEGNGNWSFAEWTGSNLFSPNGGQFSQATILNSAGRAGVTVLSSPQNSAQISSGYTCFESGTGPSGQVTLWAGNAGSITHNNAPGDSIRVEWSPGGVVNCFVNGVLVLSGSDKQFTGGQPGVFALGTAGTINAVLDNWSGGVLHPYSVSDQEEDRSQPLHVPSLTVGQSSPGSHGSLPFGALYLGSMPFGQLGTPDNGVIYFCPDCEIANPCAGNGTGAIAKRLGGVWVCN